MKIMGENNHQFSQFDGRENIWTYEIKWCKDKIWMIMFASLVCLSLRFLQYENTKVDEKETINPWKDANYTFMYCSL